MKLVVSAAAVAVLTWFAAPWVSMRWRGTVDRCALEAMRCEVRIPVPRAAPDDDVRPWARPDVSDLRDLPSAN